jgi:hypothetical protein
MMRVRLLRPRHRPPFSPDGSDYFLSACSALMAMGWGNVRGDVLPTVLARDSSRDRESQSNSGFALLEGVAQPERIAVPRMQLEGHAWHD